MVRGPLQQEKEPDLEAVLEALADQQCRLLIREMETPRTASELSDDSGVPLSTTYRKIERLDTASLIDELIEIRDDGRHTSRYRSDFERITLTLTKDRRLDIDIMRPAKTADERLEHLWTEIRKGI